MNMNKQRLIDILKTPSPSGNEFILGRKIMKEMEKEGIATTFDSMGSIISTINTDQSFKIMMMAHMDEISLMIVGKNSDGTLRVLKNGGINPNLYLFHRVRIILEENKELYGVVISSKSSDLKDTDLAIDLGTKDEKLLDTLIGKYAIIDTSFHELQDDYFTSRALDDRLGVFIINEVLSNLKNEKLNKQVISVNSVGEETTRRGANVSSNIIKPNLAIVVDVTYTSDYPNAKTTCNVSLNKGGVICYSSTINNKLNELMIKTCEKHDIPYQKEAFPGSTYTDGDSIYIKDSGIPLLLVSIPLRYMHSPSEVANFNDVNNIIKMITEFIKDFDINTNLLPY